MMPLHDDVQLVSTDDHLIEHPQVWTDRLPSRYADSMPRIVETDEEITQFGVVMPPGSQGWMYEGELHSELGLNAVAGKKPEELGTDPLRFTDMRPGCYDPVARIADMDDDGVQASLCFPSFPRFGGALFAHSKDRELGRLASAAWNDFVLEEWCAAGPDRFIPLVIAPFWNVRESVAEIERVAAKGARALSFAENTAPLGLPSFHSAEWDPLWSVLEETGMPLCLHFGSSGETPRTSPDAPMAVLTSLMGLNSMMTLADLAFSQVFVRHPRLKVSLAEGGIGWIPYMLERMDSTWERHRFYQTVPERRPSEFYRENIWGCFISDEYGLANLELIGVDRVTWESDYPHSDSNWPNSRERLARQVKHLPDDDVARIGETNARELYNFPRST